MVDTVSLFAPHEVVRRPPLNWGLKRIWRRQTHGEIETDVYEHLESGLRVSGSDGEVTKMEVSLPRLLHGTNAKLIKSERELDDALSQALALVRQFAVPTTMEKFWFGRADLVWQFRGNPSDFIKAHWHLRHKRVRRETGHYDGQSLYWPGCGFRVRMYDKGLEQTGKPSDVVRVEVQLRGKRLRQLFGVQEAGLTALDFAQCYSVYRRILLEFDPKPLTEIHGLTELLAIGEKAGWSYQGISAFDLWARRKNPRHAKAVKRKVAKVVLHDSTIKWHDLLPEDGPPPAVELEGVGRILTDWPCPVVKTNDPSLLGWSGE